MHLFSTKKPLCGKPCGSLTVSAFVNAAAQASFIDPAEIQSRNDALNTQLHNKKLGTIDVVGDGNCFFRALSVSLHGHQCCHVLLRATIAHHVDEEANLFASSDNRVALDQLAIYISKDGFWAGEDVIYATAKALSRSIHVYFAVNSHSPLKYTPASIQVDMQSPLLLAFYDPRHYRAVSML